MKKTRKNRSKVGRKRIKGARFVVTDKFLSSLNKKNMVKLIADMNRNMSDLEVLLSELTMKNACNPPEVVLDSMVRVERWESGGGIYVWRGDKIVNAITLDDLLRK